jgi:hypothetical protein
MTTALVAENFTTLLSANITNIRFYTLQSAAGDYSGSVYWAIYDDNSGNPGTLFTSGTASPTGTLTGMSSLFFYDEYSYDIPVSFLLPAGNFWLALHNGPLSNVTPTEMLWGTTSNAGAPTGRYLDPPDGSGPSWVDSLNEHAFRLDGTAAGDIPEPSTFLLLGGSLALLSCARRRKSV